jgi:hypothetical protein
VRPGDVVLALPSGRTTKIQSVVTYDGDLESAGTSASVVLKLQDEIDLSRGDMLVSPDFSPHVSRRFAAMVVWLHPTPLDAGRTYLAKHTGRMVKASATRIRFRVDVNTLAEHQADRLEMNEIALVEFHTSSPIFFDSYEENRTTGSFILIDPLSNATVGAAMIREALGDQDDEFDGPRPGRTGVAREERCRRNGHRSAIFVVAADRNVAEALERTLFERGFSAVLVDGSSGESLDSVAGISALWEMGAVIVYLEDSVSAQARSRLKAIAGEYLFDVSAEGSGGQVETLGRSLAFAEGLRIADDAFPAEEN